VGSNDDTPAANMRVLPAVEVNGRTAFITGGAQGIGFGIALAFIKAGVKVALADVDEDALALAKAQLGALGEVETFVLDVRDREAYATTGDEVRSRFGDVTLLFNNAGVAGGAHVTRMTYALWDWIMDVNVTGVINGLQTFLPGMLQAGGGHIVNTASAAGLVAGNSGAMYHASKYAVVGLSESLAVELGPFGVGVSILCPGAVATNIMATTRRQQPRPGNNATRSEEQRSQLVMLDRFSKLLAHGASPLEVGEMVLRGVQAGQLYIFTDDLLAPYLEARHRKLMGTFEGWSETTAASS
jgi:NAD(P)-dependent dehydrogenase (short-subunit alcohol dehydrogenase family)